MKKIAVLLSGCGFLDGSEITEAVSALIALGQQGAIVECFAPNFDFTSMDHISQKPAELRNSLTEASRIARGKIKDVTSLKVENFDGLLLPGGFGAAKNLCTWATKGSSCEVLPEVERVIRGFYKDHKPIAAICIAPALVARVLGREGVSLTIGDDVATAKEIQKTGATHENCPVDEYISDRAHRILSTPAYMYEAEPHEVFLGISKMIKEFVEIA